MGEKIKERRRNRKREEIFHSTVYYIRTLSLTREKTSTGKRGSEETGESE